MFHARGGLRGKEVTSRRLEKFQNRLILERRRVRYIDNDLRARERFRQPLASDGVDAGVR